MKELEKYQYMVRRDIINLIKEKLYEADNDCERGKIMNLNKELEDILGVKLLEMI